jgi:hypothetical protein
LKHGENRDGNFLTEISSVEWLTRRGLVNGTNPFNTQKHREYGFLSFGLVGTS